MSRFKSITLSLLASFAVCATASSPAFAVSPSWWVNSKHVAVGETDAVAEATEVKTAFKAKSTRISGECKSIKVNTGQIEGEKQGAVKALVFGECVDLTEPTKCAMAGFSTKPMVIALEGTTGNLKLNFTPTSGVEVFTITISNKGTETCHAAGVFVIDGSMACVYPNVETEAERHELLFSNTSGSELTVAGLEKEKFEFTGADLFWLASKLKWSAK